MSEPKNTAGLLGREISRKTIFILLLCGLALLLLPMLVIAHYDIPSADDYYYGITAHQALTEYGTITAALSAAAKRTAYTYMTWQGSFSAVFLMVLQPAVFGEQFYFITAYIMLASLLGGIFFFCYTFFGKLFGGDKYFCGSMAVVISVLCTQFVGKPSESFYWFNGSIYYTFYVGASLIACALIIRYILGKKRRVGMAVGIALLLAFIGGGNYVTALLTAELLALAVMFLALTKNGRWKDALIFFAVFMAAFLTSALAPGNAVRQAMYMENPNVIGTILNCFKSCAWDVVKWTFLPVAVLFLFLIPLSADMCMRTEYKFKYPVIVTVLSFCLLSSMYCPPLYGMGTVEWRVSNTIFFGYIFFAALNIIYWTGWALRKYEKLRRETKGIKLWLIVAALVLFMGGTVLTAMKWNVTSVHSAVALCNGGAKSYYDTYQQRLEILNDDSIRDVVFAPYEYRPFVLYFSDVSHYAQDARNINVCDYYNKDSVVLYPAYEDYLS